MSGTVNAPPLYKSPWLWGFLVGAAVLTALPFLQRGFLHAPPPLVTVGPWTLTGHQGAPFGSRDLAGKVWVADFFFTRCPSVCPELTRKMKQVEEAFETHGDRVHFVSFSVDPEHDRPEVLRAYAEKHGLDLSRWTLVTGDLPAVKALLTGRMFFHIGEKTRLSPDEGTGEKAADAAGDDEALYDIAHLGRFALFDQNGDLRATFTTDEEGLSALGSAARLLVEHGPNP